MLLGFYFLGVYMIRTYKPKHKFNISKLLRFFKQIEPEVEDHYFEAEGLCRQFFYNENMQDIKEHIFDRLPMHISKSKLILGFLICEGSILNHTDKLSNTCFIIPIKIHKNNYFCENYKDKCLQVGMIYSFNDYLSHGLYVPNSRCITYLVHISF